MKYLNHEEYIQRQRAQVLAICKGMLAGDIGIILGSRMLTRLRFEVDEEEDPDFLIFKAIDSETDHLPVDEERQNWAESTLLRKDVEIKKYEDFHRGEAFEGCHALITKFGPSWDLKRDSNS
jgi:hypothetical protein